LLLLSHESFVFDQQVSDLCVWTSGITRSGWVVTVWTRLHLRANWRV